MTALTVLEWSATLCCMLSAVYLLYHNRLAFVFCLISNTALITFSVHYGYWGFVLLNVFYMVMNILSLIKWSKL